MEIGQRVRVTSSVTNSLRAFIGTTGVITTIRRYYEVRLDYPLKNIQTLLFKAHEIAPNYPPTNVNEFLREVLLPRISNG